MEEKMPAIDQEILETAEDSGEAAAETDTAPEDLAVPAESAEDVTVPEITAAPAVAAQAEKAPAIKNSTPAQSPTAITDNDAGRKVREALKKEDPADTQDVIATLRDYYYQEGRQE